MWQQSPWHVYHNYLQSCWENMNINSFFLNTLYTLYYVFTIQDNESLSQYWNHKTSSPHSIWLKITYLCIKSNKSPENIQGHNLLVWKYVSTNGQHNFDWSPQAKTDNCKGMFKFTFCWYWLIHVAPGKYGDSWL